MAFFFITRSLDRNKSYNIQHSLTINELILSYNYKPLFYSQFIGQMGYPTAVLADEPHDVIICHVLGEAVFGVIATNCQTERPSGF